MTASSSSGAGPPPRIFARTPRNLAPILDAGTSQLLKRLTHETFASFAHKFLPTPAWKRYSHEIAALLGFHFALVSLLRDGGTVGESLYWIAREDLLLKPKSSSAGGARRRLKLACLAALVHVAGPYLDNKLAQLREEAEEWLSVQAQIEASEQQQGRDEDRRAFSGYTSPAAVEFRLFSLERVKRALLSGLVRTYPVAKFLCGLQDVFSRVRFTAGLSSHATLEHWLVEMPVSRLSHREWDAQNKLRGALRREALSGLMEARAGGPAWRRWAAVKLLRGRHFVEDYNKLLLAAFALSCKALEWWYSRGEEAAKAASTRGKNLPPPPAPEPDRENGLKLPNSPKLCPICRRMKQDPTVLTVTGYVFCYNCIMLHVKEHRKCPITCVEATEAHVRKLYFT
ncbi:peroxisome biogenesis protein [Chloropicon primus]|uniref:Peroxin-12 n=1 Tax=Chloropicon primus TaxID=1764295 RepID=A0A5B8MJE6_9CHLO|nr:peroxisome biogenesis protein [Chloropicon primus]UPQ99610.1 peroxisome biogenesis protein [Chloropicon primus]|eukprot:QDZ20401.1 peroxisome biogenesis protein [Chloropicon primus]